MNIYAIRDNLLGYFMQPFAGHNEKEVMAAVAITVNRQENLSEIQNAPHHFEIWKLGEVEEDGHIRARKEFIIRCDSLIRRDLRARDEPEEAKRARENRDTHQRSIQAPGRHNGAAGAADPISGQKAEAGPEQAQETPANA